MKTQRSLHFSTSLHIKHLFGTREDSRSACLFREKEFFEGMPTALQHLGLDPNSSD